MKACSHSVMGMICLNVFLILLLGGQITHSEPPITIREYQVKAMFLLNFGKFTDFPDDSNSDGKPVEVCVLGDDPFQGTLDILVKSERIHDRPIEIHYIQNVDPDETCHILFISQSERERFMNILARFKGKPTLTVSDIENFVILGGMIQFYLTENKVRFFIDPVTATEAGLQINARLLQIAKIVRK